MTAANPSYENQQIIISGLGGQGVLFITKLLAGAAMSKGLPVLTSETHGMAQRGGNVISYLKIGDFSGPLIRPGQADGLIALKAESFDHHRYFLKPGAVAAVNSARGLDIPGVVAADATATAKAAGSARSENIVMLGFFAAVMSGHLFDMDSLAQAVQDKFKGKDALSSGLIDLMAAGFRLCQEEK